MAEGFREVYRRYGEAIHAYATRLTGDRGTAEDVCQETFLRYLAHERELAGRNGSLAPWLFRVATNLGIDRLRRRRPSPLDALGASAVPEAGAGPDPLERRDLAEQLRAAVDALPPDLRAAFLLRAHHGLTFPALADVLGISERGAKHRYRRARDLLSERLGPWLEEEDR